MTPTSEPSVHMSAFSAQGARSHQEDRVVHERYSGGWLLAVFDGHRGTHTAEKAANIVISEWESLFASHAGHVEDTLRSLFIALNEFTREDSSGSTASVVFIPKDLKQVTLGVLGDSPIAVLDAAGQLHIGPDHNVRTNLTERRAAESRGAFYRKGYIVDTALPNVGIQMGRSLGDADLSRILSREPDIQTVPLGREGIVLVGSDGLFGPEDASNPDQLLKITGMIRQGWDADAVVHDALRRHTGDNVTAIVWKNS